MHGWVGPMLPTLEHKAQCSVPEPASSQPSSCSEARLTTLALKYSPARFNAYSAAWSARRCRDSLVAVFCSNNATFEEARMITVRMNKITSATISVTTPRWLRTEPDLDAKALMGLPMSV